MKTVLLKLITGEEIIATCDSEVPVFRLSKVRKVVQFPAPAPNGVQWPVSLIPYWAGASSEDSMHFPREMVAFHARPSVGLEEAYLQTVSGIQIAHA